MATLVQTVLASGNISCSATTIGNLLVVAQAWRQLTADPTPPNDGETWTLIDQADFVDDHDTPDPCSVVVYATVATSSKSTYNQTRASSVGSSGGTLAWCVFREISGAALGDITSISLGSQLGSVQDIGDLGTVASGDLAFMVVGNGQDLTWTQTVTPGSWTVDYGTSRDTTSTGSTTLNGQNFPFCWHLHRAGAGADIEATITISESRHWGGIGFVVATSPIPPPDPEPGVWIDWDDDGFATGAHNNATADAMGWDISRGSGPQVTSGAQPGSCTLTLKNPDDIYNPRNTYSPLYGLLRDGVRVWIGVNNDGTLTGSNVRGLFAGRITDITAIPAGGADDSPTVEIVCEDFLGWARRLPVHLDYAEGRSHGALRQAALDYVGETHYDLDDEITTMPLSHADTDLLSVLEGINAINGTRHFAKPADNFTDWFSYTTRNRQWRLDGSVDSSIDASSDHVTGTSGWRLSADTTTNQQKATVQPIEFTLNTFTVWQAQKLPIGLTTRTPQTIWVEFDDVVFNAVLNIAYTGSSVTSALTVFGTTAKLELSTGGTSTITALSIEGRLARRPPQESYIADDLTSQAAPRGIRAGSEIGGEYLGVLASARGIAEHVVWRYADPQLRPGATVENWFPDQFDRDLYDNLGFTSSQLKMAGQVFEIVGLQHHGVIAAEHVQYHTTDYVLQESKVQADPGWFILDSSLLDGSDQLSY
jgi:hypothetical protein